MNYSDLDGTCGGLIRKVLTPAILTIVQTKLPAKHHDVNTEFIVHMIEK